jgi:hypothetical protein
MRVVALLGAFGLAAIPIFVLIDTALSSPPPAVELASPVPVPSTSPTPGASCPGPESAVLSIALHQIDVTNGLLTANLSICIGAQISRQLRSSDVHASSPSAVLTIPGFASVFSRPIAQIGSSFEQIGSLTVPLQGNPRLYPLDSYATSIEVALSGPGAGAVPLILSVSSDPGVGNFDWSNAQTGAGSAISQSITRGHGVTTSGAFQSVAIQARRPVTTRLFVLCLVLIPLLLIALLALQVSQRTPRSVDGLVGVIAILLAILPIRAVLVPGDIGSLTLVDFVLASEMAILAAGTAWWYLRPQPRSSDAEPSHPTAPAAAP